MRKLLKWTGIGLGVVLALVVVAAAGLYVAGGSRLHRSYDVPVADLDIPADEASIARGRHLVEAVTVCRGCHGDDLSGGVLIDEPLIATVYASNLTAGKGGVGSLYTDADYVRAIRHGVNRDGRGLMIMHSDAYHNLSERDLASIIAYIRSMPPVDEEQPPTKPGPLGRILVALGVFDSEALPLIPAETIDHDAPFAAAPPPGETAEYGEYVVSIGLCRMCHGLDLTGGPPIDEGAPPGPNIAVYGMSDGWSREQFINTVRSGVTPYAKELNPEFMPWKVFGNMTDEELGAIWEYLASLNAG